MPPPRTVTCYICGRDFGSRSIGIHLPSCTKKWEQEQEKLPKKERRPLPTAPVDFDKVVKGEVKGKALAKINQQAADEFNEAALEACVFCARTFLPTALAHHKSACTEEKPMAKKVPGESYTAQAKAKVNYPKLKPKASKAAAETATEKAQEKKQEKVQEKVEEKAAVALEIQINQEKKQDSSPPAKQPATPKVTKKPPTGPAAKPALPELDNEEDDCPTSGASSMVMVSRPASNRSSLDLETEEEKEARAEEEARELAEREEFEALERAAALEEAEPAPIQARPRKSTTTLSRGPGTFRKSPTYVSKDIVKTRTGGVSREDLISYLEQEGLLEEAEHRREVLALVTDYAKKVRKQQMELILASPVLDNQEVMEEAVNLMQDFVRRKNL